MEKAPCIINKKTVSLLGLNSKFGQLTSLLLKQSNAIKNLSLYDEEDISAACDVALINTPCKVRAFQGKDQLSCAIKNADIILIGDPSNYYCDSTDLILDDGAPRIVEYGKVIAETCSKAIVLVAANPVNSLLPLLSQVLTFYNTYDCNKVLGVTSVDNMRANSILARHLKSDPRCVVLPIVGGNTSESRVPIFSQSRPQVKLSKKIIKRITKEIKNADGYIFRKKKELEAVNKAHATTRFVHSVLAALRGEQNIAEIAFARSVLMPGTNYYALPFILGINGIEYRFPLPDLTKYEEKLISHSVTQVYRDVKKGEKYFTLEDTNRSGDLVDCKEKGFIIDKLFSELRGKKNKEKGNLEYMLLTQKQSIQMPTTPRPSKYPVPAFLEPFDQCYEGCNPIELPELPTDRRKLPPSSTTDYSPCCYEEADPPVAIERKPCEPIGNCKFQTCNFPFIDETPKHISSIPSQFCCEALSKNNAPITNYMVPSSEHSLQSSKQNIQKEAEYVQDDATEDVHQSPLTEHTKLETNQCPLRSQTSVNSDSNQQSSSTSLKQTSSQYEPSTSFQQEPTLKENLNEPDTNIPLATHSCDSTPSSTNCLLTCQKSNQDESKISKESSTINAGEKKNKEESKKSKPNEPKDPPPSQSCQSSSPTSQSSSSSSMKSITLKDKARQFFGLKPEKSTNQNLNKENLSEAGAFRQIIPDLKSPDEVPTMSDNLYFNKNTTDLLKQEVDKISKDTLIGSKNSQLEDHFSRNKEKITILSNVKSQKIATNENLFPSTVNLNKALKRDNNEKEIESKETFKIRQLYKKLFCRTEKETAQASGKSYILNSKEMLNKEKLPISNNEEVRNNQISKQSVNKENLTRLSEENESYERPSKRVIQKSSDVGSSCNVKTQMYAPKCPPKYLFGEYIEHPIENENIAFDNVKEVKSTFGQSVVHNVTKENIAFNNVKEVKPTFGQSVVHNDIKGNNAFDNVREVKPTFGQSVVDNLTKENIAFDNNVKEVEPTFGQSVVQNVTEENIAHENIREVKPTGQSIYRDAVNKNANMKLKYEIPNLNKFQKQNNISASTSKHGETKMSKVDQLKAKIEMKFKKTREQQGNNNAVRNTVYKKRSSVIALTSPNSNDFKFSLAALDHIKKNNSMKTTKDRCPNRDPNKIFNPYNVRHSG